jgi:hypothetical protein
VFQKLHTLLIPSKRNRFHPHVLRPVGLVLVALVLAFIPTVYNVVSTGKMQVLGYATNISVGDVHTLSNAQRSSAGVPNLSLNATLNQAAVNKANHMFANDYWAHTAPDGTIPWSFINGAGYSYSFAGENLAKNFMTSSGVVNGWMNSPGHRDNVLNDRFVDVGYGVVNGVLQGQEVTLVVALYAAPVTIAQAPDPEPAPAPAPSTPQAAPTPAPTAQEPVAEEPAPQEEEDEPAPVAATETNQQPPRNEALTTESSTELTPTTSAGSVAGAIVTAPIEAYQGLNWGQKTSLFLLSVIALLYIMKHTAIWRQNKRALRSIWLRSHPLAQAIFLIAISTVTLASGAGTIL